MTLFFQVSVWCQKTSNSPLSSYGLGEFGMFDHASFSGFGNVSVPICDSLNLNFQNPASYSFLGIGQPLFSSGISSKFSTFSENNLREKNKLNAINHFALGIPFAKRFGLGIGLKPFTRKGYDFYGKEVINTDSIISNYKGTGGINEVFAGLSLKLLNIKQHKISIGSNLGYLFGSVKDERLANISTQKFGAVEQKSYQIKSLYYQFGLNYYWDFKPNQAITFGLVYAPAQHLVSFKNTGLSYANDITDEKTFIKINTVYEKGEIVFPGVLTLGASYTYRPKVDSDYNKTKIPQVKFLSEFNTINWSNYAGNFASDKAYNFQNSNRISFGVEYTPHYNYLDRSKTISYFHKIKYKTGFQYANLPVQLANKQVTSRLITCGFSFPVTSQRSVSSINVGFTRGEIGKGTLLNEKFMGFNLGVNIAPGTYDRWFRKYKID